MKQISIPTYTLSDTDMVFSTNLEHGYISAGSMQSISFDEKTAHTTDQMYNSGKDGKNAKLKSGSKKTVIRTYPLKLRDMPSDDRPREKLIEQGPQSLSLQELIAVVLQVGTKSEDVLSISKKVVREYGHSALVSQLDAKNMAESLQIPIGKACQIVACSEIGKRLYKKNDFGLQVIRTAQDVFDYLKDMHALPKEQLRGIYLDTHNRVIHDEVISIGTLNSNIVHPREVFRPALEYGAAAIVLAHNHPSGIETPSGSDVEITQQLIKAGKIIGIRILDHIIISKNGFESVDVDYE